MEHLQQQLKAAPALQFSCFAPEGRQLWQCWPGQPLHCASDLQQSLGSSRVALWAQKEFLTPLHSTATVPVLSGQSSHSLVFHTTLIPALALMIQRRGLADSSNPPVFKQLFPAAGSTQSVVCSDKHQSCQTEVGQVQVQSFKPVEMSQVPTSTPQICPCSMKCSEKEIPNIHGLFSSTGLKLGLVPPPAPKRDKSHCSQPWVRGTEGASRTGGIFRAQKAPPKCHPWSCPHPEMGQSSELC